MKTDEALFVDDDLRGGAVPLAARRRPPATRWPKRSRYLHAQPAVGLRAVRRARRRCARASSTPATAGPTPRAASAGRAPLPDVPTLILSGAQDLRTPTSNARARRRADPRRAGRGRPLHRPLGDRQRPDRLRGARRSTAFFSGQAGRARAPRRSDVLAPTPVTAAQHRRDHARPHGLGGRAGTARSWRRSTRCSTSTAR